jgi:hypothetical protein
MKEEITIEDIIKRCEGGVYLEVNAHKNYYESTEFAIKEQNARAGYEEIDPELSDRMIKEDTIISLQFYPDTPVGFYKVYGTSIDEVLIKAKECLDSN